LGGSRGWCSTILGKFWGEKAEAAPAKSKGRENLKKKKRREGEKRKN